MKRSSINSLSYINEHRDSRPYIFWGLLLLAMFLRYGYYGFQYFPVIDDNNMYGVFSLQSPYKVLTTYKMFTTRPAAAFLDAFVISRFWDSMWVMLVCITLLHFASCVLIWKIMEKNNIKIGVLAVSIFALFPLGTDATYWIAASSRIVIGLFFAAISLYFLMRYIEKSEERNGKPYLSLTGFIVFNLISLGFYEQVIAFSFVCTLLLVIVNFSRLRNRLVVAIPFVNLGIIGLFYKYFSSAGNMAARGQLVRNGIIQHTLDVFERIYELFTAVPFKMLKNGVVNGLNLILLDRAFIFLIVIAAISVLFAFFHSREITSGNNILKLLLGVFLLLVPFGPFFLLQTIWISNRNTFISFIGLGLILEALICFLPRSRVFGILRGIFTGAMIFVFLVVNTAETADFRTVNMIDREIVSGLSEVLDKSGNSKSTPVTAVVFNTKSTYTELTSSHLSNCTGSDWALTGAYQAIEGRLGTGYMLPVQNGKQAQIASDKFKNAVYIGMEEDRSMFPLRGVWQSGKMLLKKEDDTVFGSVEVHSDNVFYFEKAE